MNSIKIYPTNTCLFSILCDETGNMHKALLLQVEFDVYFKEECLYHKVGS